MGNEPKKKTLVISQIIEKEYTHYANCWAF